jgi:hypothetical protein
MSEIAGTPRHAVQASPGDFLIRAIVFGLLAVGAVAAVVTAGSWWAAGIALLGKLAAGAGIVVSVLALLREDQARSWRASQTVALVLAGISAAAIGISLAVS